MPKLTAIAAAVLQTVLIYGPPKVGKTELAGELARHPEIAGIIWIDAENGVETLKKLPPEAQEKITVISLPDTRHNPVAIETCLKLVRGLKVSICVEHGKVDCAICRKERAVMETYELNALPSNWVVVFDSLTQITDSAIAYITRNQPDDYKLQYDDWGDLGKLMAVFLSHVQQAKYNCIVISHETEATNEDGTVRVVPVGGTRNFSRNVPKYFAHCVYCRVAGKKHTFVSSTTGLANVVAGSRADIRLEDVKDGRPSLFPIFAAAAKSAKLSSVATDVVVKRETSGDSGKPAESNGDAAESNGSVSGTKSSTDVSTNPGTISDSSDGTAISKTEEAKQNTSQAPAIDHEAAMAGMKLMEKIKYRREHGLS